MKLTLASIGLLMLLAVGVSAQETYIDQNSTFDFSQPHRFAVKIGTPWGDQAAESALKQAIAKRLEKKGWSQADESSADVLVIAHGAGPGKQTLRSFYSGLPGLGWYWIGAPAIEENDEYQYKEGTLLLDIFDARTKKGVYRGVALDAIRKSGNNEKRMDKAAKQLLNDLPSARSS
ncbi:MAG TPA: DUF4136 domain-containing protein [Candidatus Angelobacter sp.]